MKIQGLEKLSLVDYDGYAACTVFLAGCNLRCPYCHNAALVTAGIPEAISEEDFFLFLEKRRGLLDAVCISGGEPTLRAELPDFCRRIKALGYRVKLDTNGTSPRVLASLVRDGLIDYVAMDIKTPLCDYPSLLSADEDDPAHIGESIAFLLSSSIPFEFRTTLVDEMVSDEDILRIGDQLRGAPLLFLQKFEDQGGNLVEGLTAVPYETAEHYAELLRPYVTRSEEHTSELQSP